MQTWACYLNIYLKSSSDGHGHREEKKNKTSTTSKIMMFFMNLVLGPNVGIKLYRKGNSDGKRVENSDFFCIDDPSIKMWLCFLSISIHRHIPISNLLFPKVNTI